MKSKFGFLILWVVAFSLASVLVGGFLSFHLEYNSNFSKIASQETELHTADLGHSHDNEFDPCSQGHCHLGHCAVVIIPKAQELSALSLYSTSYHSKEFYFVSRFLDGPFQPPRDLTSTQSQFKKS